MKTHKVLFLALIVSAVLAVSAEAGDRHRNNSESQAAPSRARSSGQSFSSGSGFRQGGGRTFAPSPRMTTRSMPTRTFSQRSTFNSGRNGASFSQRRFTPSETVNRSNRFARFENNENVGATQGNRLNRFSSLNNSNRGVNAARMGNGAAQFQNNRTIQTNRFSQMQGQRGNRTAQLQTGRGNRTVGNITPGHNHVFAQQSVTWHRDWDHHSDHWWNGHRCRWVNNSWFIFDIGFIPWFGWPYCDYYAYDYYPYGYPSYGYGYPSGYGYDSGAYYGQNGYDSSDYDQGNYNSSNYDQGSDSSYDQSSQLAVADAQDRLARAGYYHGKIDGVLGPETRHALVRYQSDKGLDPSGNLTPDTLRSLGLQRVAQE